MAPVEADVMRGFLSRTPAKVELIWPMAASRRRKFRREYFAEGARRREEQRNRHPGTVAELHGALPIDKRGLPVRRNRVRAT
jgi:hypothetical protein